MRMIRDHLETATFLTKTHPGDMSYNFGYIRKSDEWKIEESNHSIQGYTLMTNFDMFAFLIAIDIPNTEIHYERD